VAELLEHLAKRLVDDPGSVRVEEVEHGGELILRLHVAQADLGKVIGRQGRIARALRALARAASAAQHRRVVLEIVD
jgi:hypothetical protein